MHEVGQGLTQGESRDYLIGFEGSGLTSDESIVLISSWYDQKGRPLPKDLPGYTGRLAQLAPNQEYSDIAHFGIEPGSHLQLIKLPREDLSRVHYYLHVNGEPREGHYSFVSRGAGYGNISYRLKNCTPIKVPRFNKFKDQTDDSGEIPLPFPRGRAAAGHEAHEY